MKKNSVCKTGYSGMESSQKPFKRRALLMGGGVFASMLLVNPTDLLAQAEHADGPSRINLSGHQRMLIQRAGKFVCLAYQNPDPAPLLAAATETLALHQTIESGLRDGDDELGLEPETNASVLSALTRANNAFAPYGQTIKAAIERRDVKDEHIQEILNLNSPALEKMDDSVNLLERVYTTPELSEQMAILINISGRQRMFTQRLVLLLCLSRSGLASPDTRQELFRVMNRFSISLNILNRVTPGALPDEKSQPIIERLNSVQGDWAALRELISTNTRSTGTQVTGDILDVDKQAEDLLKRMDAIVLLYEEAAA